METYYWESELGEGSQVYSGDQEAEIKLLRAIPNLWLVYKESDTDNGMPFIIVYESERSEP